jgi:hypothetical protein
MRIVLHADLLLKKDNSLEYQLEAVAAIVGNGRLCYRGYRSRIYYPIYQETYLEYRGELIEITY